MPHVCKCHDEISEQSRRIAELEQQLAASQSEVTRLRKIGAYIVENIDAGFDVLASAGVDDMREHLKGINAPEADHAE